MLILIIAVSFAVGSIPTGALVVRGLAGTDWRQEHGRERFGATEALRAAGLPGWLLTAGLDFLKGASAVWIASALLPAEAEAAGMLVAGLAALVGHHYSLFLRFRGADDGFPLVGSAFALWPWSAVIILPIGLAVLVRARSAVLATIAMALSAAAVSAYRAYFDDAPAAYIVFGIGAVVVVAWRGRAVLKQRWAIVVETRQRVRR